jgi:hypothetical protein
LEIIDSEIQFSLEKNHQARHLQGLQIQGLVYVRDWWQRLPLLIDKISQLLGYGHIAARSVHSKKKSVNACTLRLPQL